MFKYMHVCTRRHNARSPTVKRVETIYSSKRLNENVSQFKVEHLHEQAVTVCSGLFQSPNNSTAAVFAITI